GPRAPLRQGHRALLGRGAQEPAGCGGRDDEVQGGPQPPGDPGPADGRPAAPRIEELQGPRRLRRAGGLGAHAGSPAQVPRRKGRPALDLLPHQRVPAEAVIRIAEVTQTFRRARKETRALERVSLDVRAGEFVCVVGPSGCGKSTLLRIVAGLLRPVEGRVELAGQAVEGPQTNLGIVFQSPVLLEWRTVLDNVLLQLELRGIDPSL